MSSEWVWYCDSKYFLSEDFIVFKKTKWGKVLKNWPSKICWRQWSILEYFVPNVTKHKCHYALLEGKF